LAFTVADQLHKLSDSDYFLRLIDKLEIDKNSKCLCLKDLAFIIVEKMFEETFDDMVKLHSLSNTFIFNTKSKSNVPNFMIGVFVVNQA
jgi:hypothetical protein